MSNEVSNSEMSIREAAMHCNVSEQTLRRFIQAGYIRAIRTDGDQVYLDDLEVSKLLGVKPKYPKIIPSAKIPNKVETRQTYQSNIEIEVERSELKNHAEPEPVNTASQKDLESDSSAKQKSEESEDLIRLKHLCALQEQLLKKQDDDIADLKTQRQWLQSRVEKLEQKADRDQLMLLSHTQSIVKILDQKGKTSPLHRALSWMGLSIAHSDKHNKDYETFNTNPKS